ncbi:MAG: hypothetical protein OEV74_18060 [Cyclobacteriaceae bacterium]|jgi:hypothetical protein|nr:hypothetical protein [Cyclobacteriaceae bacterium]MDH4298188.1 hypothetical protein [Cyclobacteriaceae bacterium]MDH5250091.1 hypothetical protein [Cyclobacteriaceae bacterium]
MGRILVDIYCAESGKKIIYHRNVPSDVRLSRLDGYNASQKPRNISSFFSNPALDRDALASLASVGSQFPVTDIGHGTVIFLDLATTEEPIEAYY